MVRNFDEQIFNESIVGIVEEILRERFLGKHQGIASHLSNSTWPYFCTIKQFCRWMCIPRISLAFENIASLHDDVCTFEQFRFMSSCKKLYFQTEVKFMVHMYICLYVHTYLHSLTYTQACICIYLLYIHIHTIHIHTCSNYNIP